MISPAVGRKVWYRPLTHEMQHTHTQPLDATVTHVWNDNCVNLQINGENGVPWYTGKTSVTLAQDRPAQPGECEWAPYQKGQAARAETPMVAQTEAQA